MECPGHTKSVNGWTKCEKNTHKSVIYVYYGLHNIDLVSDSWVITQFGQLLPQTYVSLKRPRNFQHNVFSKCLGLYKLTISKVGDHQNQQSTYN